MKATKSDLFFGIIFAGFVSITIIAAIAIWPTEKRFDTLWYSVGFLVFLEALFFLKPIALSHVAERGGAFWVVIFSFNFLYSFVGLIILVLGNLVSHGRGVLVPIVTVGWTLIFLFFTGIFTKVADADAKENANDEQGRAEKMNLGFYLTEPLASLKRWSLANTTDGSKLLPEIAIIEKLVAHIGAGRGDATQAQLDAEIMGIGDELAGAVKEGKEAAFFEERLGSLKTKLRMRERVGRR
jgi:hypothetical protein